MGRLELTFASHTSVMDEVAQTAEFEVCRLAWEEARS
jgi:hypothetical protein